MRAILMLLITAVTASGWIYNSGSSVPRTFTGVVVDRDGRAVQGAVVETLPGRQSVTTDDQGHFSLSCALPGHSPFWNQPNLLVRYADRKLAAFVHPGLDKDVTDLRIELLPAITVAGRVLDEEGNPLPDAQITLWGELLTDLRTDSHGRYEISPLPHDLTASLEISRDGYGTSHLFLDFADAVDLQYQAKDAILKKADQTVSGVVLDDAGNPVPGATVSLWGTQQPRWTEDIITDQQGRFVVQGVCKGYLGIMARNSGRPKYLGGSKEITVGETDLIRIVIQPHPHERRTDVDPAALIARPLPNLDGLTLDVAPVQLDGKTLLICFWDENQRPSRHAMKVLAEQGELLSQHRIVLVTIHASPIEPKQLQEILSRYGIITVAGQIKSEPEKLLKQWNAAGLPWLVLTDEFNTIQAEGFFPDQLPAIVSGENSSSQQASPDAPDWRTRFNQVYRLEDGQTLKRITAPFIPERKEYYTAEFAHQASIIPEPPDRFVFHWDGRLARWASLCFGDAGTIGSTLDSVLGLRTYEFEGTDALLKLGLPGDWVVRRNSSTAERLEALHRILHEELGRDIRFEKRRVEREVIVAKGRFNFQPLPETRGRQVVQFFADKPDPGDGGHDGIANHRDVAQWLLPYLADRPVVDRTESRQDQELIGYCRHSSSYLYRLPKGPDRDARLNDLLETLSKQTSLTFSREPLPIDVWFVTEQAN